MSVLALIPARAGSKGIPGKNFRELGGVPLWAHAVLTAMMSGPHAVVISSDAAEPARNSADNVWLERPPELAQDDTPMIAVVQHALQVISGPPRQIIVLLQPTQPFRTPKHVTDAIALLESSGADSVVSVVPVESPQRMLRIEYGHLESWLNALCSVERRQDSEPAYKRDGTVYAFRRSTVERYRNIYGVDCRPLIVEPEETCELDTEADWRAVEYKWARTHKFA